MAPPVVYPVGRSARATVFVAVLCIVALALNVAWSLAGANASPEWAWVILASATAALVWHWARPTRGQIEWDGGWLWRSSAYPQGTPLHWPEVVLDAQQLMLVRLRNADGAIWTLWLDASTQPQYWLDLRRALLATPRPADRDEPPKTMGATGS